VVVVVPQLCCKEDLLARNARLLDGFANGLFGAVYESCVNVPVAGLQCVCDGAVRKLSAKLPSFLDAADVRLLGLLVLPGSKADGRDLSSGVEREGGAVVSHSDLLCFG
jgi:hypothetical protein